MRSLSLPNGLCDLAREIHNLEEHLEARDRSKKNRIERSRSCLYIPEEDDEALILRNAVAAAGEKDRATTTAWPIHLGGNIGNESGANNDNNERDNNERNSRKDAMQYGVRRKQSPQSQKQPLDHRMARVPSCDETDSTTHSSISIDDEDVVMDTVDTKLIVRNDDVVDHDYADAVRERVEDEAPLDDLIQQLDWNNEDHVTEGKLKKEPGFEVFGNESTTPNERIVAAAAATTIPQAPNEHDRNNGPHEDKRSNNQQDNSDRSVDVHAAEACLKEMLAVLGVDFNNGASTRIEKKEDVTVPVSSGILPSGSIPWSAHVKGGDHHSKTKLEQAGYCSEDNDDDDDTPITPVSPQYPKSEVSLPPPSDHGSRFDIPNHADTTGTSAAACGTDNATALHRDPSFTKLGYNDRANSTYSCTSTASTSSSAVLPRKSSLKKISSLSGGVTSSCTCVCTNDSIRNKATAATSGIVLESSCPVHGNGTGLLSSSFASAGSSASSSMMLKRNVSFSKLQIREYSIALSDHPACSWGPPVQLGWEYQDTDTVPVDVYEETRVPRRTMEQMVLSYNVRRYLLLKRAGYTKQELQTAMNEVDRIKRSRLVTDLLLPVSPIDEAIEEVVTNVKNIFSF